MSISVMDRAFRLDEIGFSAFRGEADFPAVVLTDYAEVRTENGAVGGQAGSYVVDGPNGIEVLSAVEFGDKYTFEPTSAEVVAAEVDPGFTQDLDAAVVVEVPATAEKGTGEPGDTPGDFAGSPNNPQAEVEGSDPDDGHTMSEATVESTEEDNAEPPSETEDDETGNTESDTETPPSEDDEEEAVVSQFESLSDQELWDVANDLEIETEGDVSRPELIILIDTAVAEAENATEASE